MKVMSRKGKSSYRRMSTNNVDHMIECETLYFAIIIVITDSAKNPQ